ncbi:hypothetical protein RXV95_02630 [Novosphingobium sp. ZN18A2]|uniref:hypothetical protein n=1 Tax=Novosphingobium sp. ZN18A2 TaxID=3079861 RepID=UPI0030CCE122
MRLATKAFLSTLRELFTGDAKVIGPLTRRGLAPLALAGIGAAAMMRAEDTAAQSPAGDAPGTVLDAGVHRVDANTTIRGDMQLMPGARLEIAAGRTLTVLGSFDAPISHVFQGDGTVDLNRSTTRCAYPEWWGAQPDREQIDCLPALNACLAAHPVMSLGSGNYFLSDTWVIERGFCRIWGSGFRGNDFARGTRLIVKSGTADVVQVGSSSKPEKINDFLQAVDLRYLHLARSVPMDGSAENMPAGLRAKFLLCCTFDTISAFEHAIGFYAQGVVRGLFTNCMTRRTAAARSGGISWRGFLLDGNTNIGLAGGNASIYLTDCNATIGGHPNISDPVGMLLDGAFADTYIVNFETAHVATGIRASGRLGELSGLKKGAHNDVHIRMPIIDQCNRTGIEISDTSPNGLVDISEPYIAVAPGAQAAISFDRFRGAAHISGGQFYGLGDALGGGSAAGLAVNASNGISASGLKFVNVMQPVVLENATAFSVDAWAGNTMMKSGNAAARLSNCRNGSISFRLSGQPGSFGRGIEVSASQAVAVNPSGLDAQILSSGRGGKVMVDGSPLDAGKRGGVALLPG